MDAKATKKVNALYRRCVKENTIMRITRIIAAKEIKEIIRNKYTIIIMLIPFLVYPLLSVGLSKINASSSSMAKLL